VLFTWRSRKGGTGRHLPQFLHFPFIFTTLSRVEHIAITARDEMNEEFEIDPAVAAAIMGFSGFGGRKRKFDTSNDAFIDTQTQTQATNAQSASSASAPNPTAHQGPETMSQTKSEPTLEELRYGVRNADGDVAIFLPSFIVDDPWKELKDRTS
jgi:hypothetical protein